jgi:hypothetical protein
MIRKTKTPGCLQAEAEPGDTLYNITLRLSFTNNFDQIGMKKCYPYNPNNAPQTSHPR